MKREMVALITTLFLLGISGPSFSKDKEVYTYGWQLMTPEERAKHRSRMRGFRTEQEREAYRKKHHEKMQKRAKDQGVTLPPQPLPRGKGMGSG